MGARRSGREAALQMLYQWEATGNTADKCISLFWKHFEGEPESRTYADALVEGVLAKSKEVDAAISKASEHWRLERMSRVDRNLLRIGTWELLFQNEIPRAVVIDEAVELAKSFGADGSSAFVNGVLNHVAESAGRN